MDNFNTSSTQMENNPKMDVAVASSQFPAKEDEKKKNSMALKEKGEGSQMEMTMMRKVLDTVLFALPSISPPRPLTSNGGEGGGDRDRDNCILVQKT